ncbi:MAG: hypothetical protein H7645_09720 [Candidatus Heimdallarchaeota archaeon]|nr:hypothetical protein [Candidatus Heimdallarchaeota archaeon]MCK4770605.1 hypothetical protein [Candidatus Heimdallarchaeota archaeon]
MARIILLYDSTCSNCGVKAKFGCSSCENPLCGRCISREKKDILNNILIPAGLCKHCVKSRTKNRKESDFNPLSEAITIYVTDPSHTKRFKLSRKN